MAILTAILFQLAYFIITIGHPAYQVYVSNKQNKLDRLWPLYFFIFGMLTILESTVLFPVKYALNLICSCAWSWVRMIFSLWLQHPNYRGALFIEQKFGKLFDFAHAVSSPFVGKVMSLLGAPNRQLGEIKTGQTN